MNNKFSEKDEELFKLLDERLGEDFGKIKRSKPENIFMGLIIIGSICAILFFACNRKGKCDICKAPLGYRNGTCEYQQTVGGKDYYVCQTCNNVIIERQRKIDAEQEAIAVARSKKLLEEMSKVTPEKGVK